MTEDQTPDESADEPTEEPVGDEPASPQEDPAPEEAPPADAPAPEERPASEDAPPAEEASPEAEATPIAPPAAEETAPSPEKRKDEAPGANLEPILLEDDRQLSAEERAALEAELEERARAEAAAVAEVAEEEEPLRAGAKLDLPADARIQATGKRKTSVARIVVTPGGGAFLVNQRELAEYFPRSLHQTIARQPLAVSGYDGQVDVSVRVHGGGISGQADAVRHGIAKALVEIDLELRGDLKRRGWLTRDARAKERRKAGLKKARKRPQFSKR